MFTSPEHEDHLLDGGCGCGQCDGQDEFDYGYDDEDIYDDPYDVVMYDLDVADDDLYALIEMLSDEARSWYAKRRLNALAASGPLSALVADIIVDSLGRKWDPLLHPRDRYGRFINTGGFLRWLAGGTSDWLRGRVDRIDSDGNIHVRAIGNDRIPDGTLYRFKPELANKLVSTKEPLASVSGIDDDLDADIPDFPEASQAQKRIWNTLANGDMPAADLDRAVRDMGLTVPDFAGEVRGLEERDLIEIVPGDKPRVRRNDDNVKAVVDVGDGDIVDVPEDDTPDLDGPALTKHQRDLLDSMVELDRGEGDGVHADEIPDASDDDLQALLDAGAIIDGEPGVYHLENPEGDDSAADVAPEPDITNEIFEASKIIDDPDGQEAFQHYAEELARPGNENNAPLPEGMSRAKQRNAEAAAKKWWDDRNGGPEEVEFLPGQTDLEQEERVDPKQALNARNQALADTLMDEHFPGDEFAEFLESAAGVEYAEAVRRLFDAEDYDEAGFPDQANAERDKATRAFQKLQVPQEDIDGWPIAVQNMRNADRESAGEAVTPEPDAQNKYPDGSVDLVGDRHMGQPDGEGGFLDPDAEEPFDEQFNPDAEMPLDNDSDGYGNLPEEGIEEASDAAQLLRDRVHTEQIAPDVDEEVEPSRAAPVDLMDRPGAQLYLRDHPDAQELIDIGATEYEWGYEAANLDLKEGLDPMTPEEAASLWGADSPYSEGYFDSVEDEKNLANAGVPSQPDVPEADVDEAPEPDALERAGREQGLGTDTIDQVRQAELIEAGPQDDDADLNQALDERQAEEDALPAPPSVEEPIGDIGEQAPIPEDSPAEEESVAPDASGVKKASSHPKHQKINNQKPFNIDDFPFITDDGQGVLDRDGQPVRIGQWYKAKKGGGGDLPEIVGFYDQDKYPGWLLGRNPDGKYKAVHVLGKGGKDGKGGLGRVSPEAWDDAFANWKAQRRVVGGEQLDDLDQFKENNKMFDGVPAEVGMVVERRPVKNPAGDGGKFPYGETGVVARVGMDNDGNVKVFIMQPGAANEGELVGVGVNMLQQRAVTPTPPPAPTPAPNVPSLDPKNLPQGEWEVPGDADLVGRLEQLGGEVDLIDFVNAYVQPGAIYDQVDDLVKNGKLEYVADPGRSTLNGRRPRVRVPAASSNAPGNVNGVDGAQNPAEANVLNRIDAANGEWIRAMGNLIGEDDDIVEHADAIKALVDRGVLERQLGDGDYPEYRRAGAAAPEVALPDGAENEFEAAVLNALDGLDDGQGVRGNLIDIDDDDAVDRLTALRGLVERGVLEEFVNDDGITAFRRAPVASPAASNEAENELEAEILSAIDNLGRDARNADLIDIDSPDVEDRLSALRALVDRGVLSRVTDPETGKPVFRRPLPGDADPVAMSDEEAVAALKRGVDPFMIANPNLERALKSAGYTFAANHSGGRSANNWAVSPQAGPFPVTLPGEGVPREGHVYMVKQADPQISDSILNEVLSGALSQSLSESIGKDTPGLLYHPKVSLAKAPTGNGKGAGGAIVMDHAAYGFPEGYKIYEGGSISSRKLQAGGASESIIQLGLYDFLINNIIDRHSGNQMYVKDPVSGNIQAVIIDNGYGFGAPAAAAGRVWDAGNVSFDSYAAQYMPKDVFRRADRSDRAEVTKAVEEFVNAYQQLDVDAVMQSIWGVFPTMSPQQEVYARKWITEAKSRADQLALDIPAVVDTIMGL